MLTLSIHYTIYPVKIFFYEIFIFTVYGSTK